MTPTRLLAVAALLALASPALAHGVGGSDAQFVAQNHGAALAAFAYLGAKHMVTGYDHLLYLAGVIFYARRLRDAVIYASLFSLGHSLTLILGVLARTGASSELVDAIIGLSIVYKAYENLGGLRVLGRLQPPAGLAVFAFGLVHGLGLATKLLTLRPSPDSLLGNLLAFNLGVEVGQFGALALLVAVLMRLRRGMGERLSMAANFALLVCGFVLAGFHAIVYSGIFA